MTTATRSPKGGITIMGVFYKGGQFLPTNEPQRGKWNKKSSTKTNKEIKEIKRAQLVAVTKALTARVMKMDKVWESNRMRVSKNHPYAEAHAMEVFNWHQKYGWD